MKLVIDASVALKWALAEAPDEQDAALAVALLDLVESQGHEVCQPPHWLAEIVGVMARRHPNLVAETLRAARGMDFQTADDDDIYLRAADLSHRLNQHLFDTLYHAVALERGATLVTADERYFAAAKGEGSIETLKTLSNGGMLKP